MIQYSKYCILRLMEETLRQVNALSDRESWADVMKGILIIAVVYHHVVHLPSVDLKPFYAPYFMAAFFFISGYFHKSQDSVMTVIRKKSKSLLVPLVLIGFPVYILVCWFTGNPENIADAFLHTFDVVFIKACLWFLKCLFLGHILLAILMPLYKRFPAIAVLVSLAASLTVLFFVDSNKEMNIIWNAQTAVVMQFYMVLGFLVSRHRLIEVLCVNVKWLCFLLLYIAALVISYGEARSIDVVVNEYGMPALYPILALSGTAILINISQKLKGADILILLGKHSLLIYILHGVVAHSIERILTAVGKYAGYCEQAPFTICVNVFSFVSAIMVCLIIGCLVSRYCPWLIGQRKRYRTATEAH